MLTSAPSALQLPDCPVFATSSRKSAFTPALLATVELAMLWRWTPRASQTSSSASAKAHPLSDAQSAEWDKAFGMSGGAPTQVTVNPKKPAFQPAPGKDKLDAYERMTRMIQERTQALQYETSVQATLNPLVNDYGFAMEKARAEADLLNAAERAKIEITPEVRQNISDLAEAYAQATVESERLREQQEYLVDQMADLNDLGKDVAGRLHQRHAERRVRGRGAVQCAGQGR